MYLVIDIGNSFQKAAVFSPAGELLCLEIQKILLSEHIKPLIEKYKVAHSIISTVGPENDKITTLLAQYTHLLPFTHSTPLPITIDYKQPETLGLDRIANSVAAHCSFPHDNVLSIQAGTCLVMDFTTKDGVYCGGSISPGINMRFAAIHHFTDKLPQFEKREIHFLVGDTTQHSIESGVMNGIVDEINGAIERYNKEFGKIKIVLTGGDKNDLQNSIKNAIFAASNFVLLGLYQILKFNVGE